MKFVLIIHILATGQTIQGRSFPTLEDCAMAVATFRESNRGMAFWCEEK